MTRDVVREWVQRYERAWRTPGTQTLAEIFTEDAAYRQSPYADPVVGLAEIGRMWEAERAGPDEPFTMSAEILAVDATAGDGTMAVVRVQVDYLEPAQQFLDLWVVRFAADGRCAEFEEWAYWPGLSFGDGAARAGEQGGR
jgi:hypothetical protein